MFCQDIGIDHQERFRSAGLLACSRLSDSGEDTKSWRGVLFSSSRFLNSAGPTISEPGTGYGIAAILSFVEHTGQGIFVTM